MTKEELEAVIDNTQRHYINVTVSLHMELHNVSVP